MEQDKMREEFEAWYFDRHMVVNSWDGLIYADHDQQEAWRAWRASREAVVVELPEPVPFRSREDTIQDCRAAIHAAGISTR